MDARPKISLIVPCYNVEQYCEDSLRSALNQTLRELEIICVNDGSTDSTPEILKRLAAEDSRIRIIDKPNTGYGNSVNIGFDAATADYLGILEPDDFMEPHMLETLYDRAIEFDLDISKSNYFYYWSKPEGRDKFCNQFKEHECGFVFCPREMTRVFFVQPSIWSSIYRKSFICDKRIRLNETPGASYQDASFNFETLLRCDRMYLTYEALIHYRLDNEASSVNNPGKVYCVCDEYERIYGFLDEWPDREEAQRLRLLLSPRKFSTYLWNYQRLSPDLGLEFLNRVHEEYREHERRGEIDWSLFPPERPELEHDLRAIMADPFLYHMDMTEDSDEPSALRTAKRYYQAGGLKGLGKLLARKIAR